jgi:hypothetical protein
MATARSARELVRRLTVSWMTRCRGGGGGGTGEACGVHLTRWGGGVLTEVVSRHEEAKAAIGCGD